MRGKAFHRSERGASLLETCAALAVTSALSLSMLGGLRPLGCSFRVQAARESLKNVLLDARRRAYSREVTASVRTKPGDSVVTTSWSARALVLGDGVTLVSGPADGDVQFRAGGLADNATVTLACAASTASVVVNQRGVVR
jgi:hypothetical protein